MKHALSTLDDPIIASVSPTFTMALMVICVFLDRIFTNAAWINVLWIGAVILHFILMIYFVAVHIFQQNRTGTYLSKLVYYVCRHWRYS